MRLDLHNHTRYSPDSRVDPARLVGVAVRAGLDGIAITDHNAVGGLATALAAAPPDFLVVPGTEVSTDSGHVLGYGIREPIPRGLSVRETVERIVALGGVPVAAHPFRFWSGVGERGLRAATFAAHETSNARTLRGGNAQARTAARADGVGQTGGSDSHFLDEIGRATTAIDEGVIGLDGFLQRLGAGQTSSLGRDRGASATVRYVSKCVGEWILRGMRRI